MPASPDAFRALFDPCSVAIVGASDDPLKWGHWLGVRALRGRHRREVHLVNRRAARVLGQAAVPTIGDLPPGVELVVLAVPPATLHDSVTEAIAAGARTIVAITGTATDGDAGGEHDAALAALARAADVRLLGPNCLGVFDAGAELMLLSDDLPAGPIGLLSQSGNLALEIGSLAQTAGLGFSRFASVGNQSDIEIADLLDALVAHEPTRVLAVYAEDFRDGRAVVAAAARAARAGKPVVLLAIEASDATSRAVASHTGALATDGATIDAACRAAGIHRVGSPQQLIDVAQALLGQPAPRGRRVAVLGDGGGHGSVATGVALNAGLEVPALSPALRERLRGVLPPAAATANPIDLAGAGEQDIDSFVRVGGLVLGSGEVDALVITGYFGGYHGYGGEMAERELAVADQLIAAAGAHDRPLYVHTMHRAGPALERLRGAGVPVHRQIERVLGTLAATASHTRRGPSDAPRALPPVAAPVRDLGYTAVRALLAEGGVPFAPALEVRDADHAVAAAARLGYPVAVKALGMLHKSDAGGVVLGVGDEARLRAVVADLAARLAPPAFSVEAMADLSDGVELLVGTRWDPRFGPVALVGLGGVLAEVLRDTASVLAPLTADAARDALLGLRGAALLAGVRGRPAVDVDAAARAIAALSEVAAAHPELAELEVNPLLVTPRGALGLDARAVPAV